MHYDTGRSYTCVRSTSPSITSKYSRGHGAACISPPLVDDARVRSQLHASHMMYFSSSLEKQMPFACENPFSQCHILYNKYFVSEEALSI